MQPGSPLSIHRPTSTSNPQGMRAVKSVITAAGMKQSARPPALHAPIHTLSHSLTNQTQPNPNPTQPHQATSSAPSRRLPRTSSCCARCATSTYQSSSRTTCRCLPASWGTCSRGWGRRRRTMAGWKGRWPTRRGGPAGGGAGALLLQYVCWCRSASRFTDKEIAGQLGAPCLLPVLKLSNSRPQVPGPPARRALPGQGRPAVRDHPRPPRPHAGGPHHGRQDGRVPHA